MTFATGGRQASITSMNTRNTVARQRRVQHQVAGTDRKHPPEKVTRPVQAGARRYPVPPFPRQHQSKPGSEAELNPAPLYDAPFYLGSKKLENTTALITGGDSGIGRAVAILFAREGANVVISYLNEHKDARETKKKVEAEGRECLLISGDVSDRAFCKKTVARTVAAFGQLDILVNNAAFQVHTSRFGRSLRRSIWMKPSRPICMAIFIWPRPQSVR